VGSGNLTEERLDSIERGARERRTLMDRVVQELVEEIRRLCGVVAQMEALAPRVGLPAVQRPGAT
jgi:hypothetical protein